MKSVAFDGLNPLRYGDSYRLTMHHRLFLRAFKSIFKGDVEFALDVFSFDRRSTMTKPGCLPLLNALESRPQKSFQIHHHRHQIQNLERENWDQILKKSSVEKRWLNPSAPNISYCFRFSASERTA